MEIIVVGVDGSAGSQEAVRFAAREAAAHGATLRLVTAWEVPPSVLAGGAATPDLFESFETEAKAVIAEAAAAAAALEPGVPREERIVQGHAGSVLLKESENADLVVMGRRGHGGLTEFLLGSVSHQVVDHAKCAVVIVPPAV
jgi:nucleotide-binding universal stress UspA family protein